MLAAMVMDFKVMNCEQAKTIQVRTVIKNMVISTAVNK